MGFFSQYILYWAPYLHSVLAVFSSTRTAQGDYLKSVQNRKGYHWENVWFPDKSAHFFTWLASFLFTDALDSQGNAQ